MTHISRHLFGVIAVLLALSACTPPDPSADGQELAILVDSTGTYTRPISTDSPLAQQFFDQGLRLTWGYHFPEAVASHQEALRHDAEHPMIHWGLALALGPNPNSRAGGLPDDPQGEGRRAIERAMEWVERGNEKEQAFVRAYWDDEGGPLPGTAEAAAALERVMEQRPDHPGANHLYIHLLESSNTPDRALGAADRLAALMPGVGHVVHMPGHIYVRVGQHAKSVEHNQRSAEVDGDFLAAWGSLEFPQIGTYFLSAQNHRRHAYDFIRYSAAIQGNYAQAVQAATDARSHEPEARILRGQAHKTIATRWLVHKMFGRWNELLAEDRVMEGSGYLDGMWNYTQGSAQVGLGNLDGARTHLEQVRAVAADPESATVRRNANTVATLMDLAALGLEGEIRQSQGDLEGAIAAFRAAVAIEDDLEYTEPPDWPQPMRHYLGAALLEAGAAEEAERVYRRDMELNRGDGWALFGLWQSLQAQDRTAEAAEVFEAYEQAWQFADVELTRSRF